MERTITISIISQKLADFLQSNANFVNGALLEDYYEANIDIDRSLSEELIEDLDNYDFNEVQEVALIDDKFIVVIDYSGFPEIDRNQEFLCTLDSDKSFLKYVKDILLQMFRKYEVITNFIKSIKLSDIEKMSVNGIIGTYGGDYDNTSFEELLSELNIDIKHDGGQLVNESNYHAYCAYNETTVEVGLFNVFNIISSNSFRLQDLDDLSDEPVYRSDLPIQIKSINTKGDTIDLIMYDEDYPLAPSIKLLSNSIRNDEKKIKLFFDENLEINDESIYDWSNVEMYMYKFNENVYDIAKNRCSIFILDTSLREYVKY